MNARFSLKIGQPSRLCARPKHPAKVHVCAGISAQGATQVVLFTRRDEIMYTDILDAALILFIGKHYPTDHIIDNKIVIQSTPAKGPKLFSREKHLLVKTPASLV